MKQMLDFDNDKDKEDKNPRPKAKDGFSWVKCSWCGGYGYHYRVSDNGKRCEVCNGSKYVEKPVGKKC